MTPETRRCSKTRRPTAVLETVGASSPPSSIVGRRSPGALKGRSGPPLHFVALRSSLGLRPALDRPSVVGEDALIVRAVIFGRPSRPRHGAGPGRGHHHAPGHRRRRADPRLILAQATGPFSEGHLPANCRTAVGTRAHQSGGQPTSPAPAHGRALTRSPPEPPGANS